MSGKAAQRTKRKHERRQFNDVAACRNLLSSLCTTQHDKTWARVVLAALGYKVDVYWPKNQRNNEVVPYWFWNKIERIMREQISFSLTGDVKNAKAITYPPAELIVHEINLGILCAASYELALLLGIEIRYHGHESILIVANRNRSSQMIPLKTRPRPKPPAMIASTEEVDTSQSVKMDINQALENLEKKMQLLDKLNTEIQTLRHQINAERRDISEYLKNNFGII